MTSRRSFLKFLGIGAAASVAPEVKAAEVAAAPVVEIATPVVADYGREMWATIVCSAYTGTSMEAEMQMWRIRGKQ